MNNILANGLSRFNSSSVTNNISFDFQSAILGEYAGKDLKIGNNSLSSFELQRNFYNVFLGYKAGQNSINSIKNIFIGSETGINLNGSNNIIIGKNIDIGLSEYSYNVISIGDDNRTSTYSITIGGGNKNIGFQNILLGKNNNIKGDYNTAIGNDNTLFGNSNIAFGNNTLSNIEGSIIFGNNNDFANKYNSILIGNSLNTNSNFNINIGDTLLRFDNYYDNEILFLGIENKYNSNALNIAVGFLDKDISNLDRFIINNASNNDVNSLYVKSGIYTDKITIGNYDTSNITISLIPPNISNIAYLPYSNFTYTLPLYIPNTDSNIYLTTNSNGEMSWKNFDDIYGNNKFLNLSLNSTDQLKEGTSNLYYKSYLVDARVDSRVSATFRDKFSLYFDDNYNKKLLELNLDSISNGTSNRYIYNGVYNQDLHVFGTLTVNKLQVIGTDIKNENNLNSYIKNMVENTSNDLSAVIQKLVERIVYLENVIGI